MKRILLTFLAVFSFASLANATSFVRTKDAVLPKPEALKVEELACTKHHKIGASSISAYQYIDAQIPQPFHYAHVQCKPHGEFKGAPIYFTSNCDFADKQWICGESELHISITINNRKVDVVPGSTKPELAEDILKKISTYGALRGRSIDKGIGDHCSFHSSSDPEELELQCTDHIKLSFWCPQPEITHCPPNIGHEPDIELMEAIMLDQPFYSCEIPVRWGDMDAFGHVNNTLYFRYFEETRFQWMLEKGVPIGGDTYPVVVTIGCTFFRPVFHPDTLRIEVFLSEPGRSSFMANYKVYTSADRENPCSEGYSKIVWVDKATGKSVALPDAVRAWF